MKTVKLQYDNDGSERDIIMPQGYEEVPKSDVDKTTGNELAWQFPFEEGEHSDQCYFYRVPAGHRTGSYLFLIRPVDPTVKSPRGIFPEFA